MTDLMKIVVAIALSAGVSSTATTATIGAEIKYMTASMVAMSRKLDKIDDRVRASEIKHASYPNVKRID